MGRTMEMSWEGDPNFRWTKMYRRGRYRVTCKELGVSTSKQDSYLAANEWWRRKKAELDQKTFEEEHELALRRLDRKIEYAKAHAADLVPALEATRQEIEIAAPLDVGAGADDEATIKKNLEIAALYGIPCPPGVPFEVIQHLFGNARIWKDRFVRAPMVEREKTLATCLDQFLQEVRITQKPKTHGELKRYLNWLRDDSGLWTASSDVSAINEKTVVDHFKILSGRGYEAKQFNKRLGFFRRFVNWLWMQGRLENTPRNLLSKSHRAKPKHREIKRYAGAWGVVTALVPKYRLWALLGLNCGMTEADLGALEWSWIDLKRRTLTRRRVKTGEQEGVPTVTYRLWPETLALLKALRRSPGRVFQTAKGSPMYESWYDDDGNPHDKDLFGTYWKRQKPQKPGIPLGKFRSIGATTLWNDSVFGQYKDYFLALAPKTVSEKHYAAPANEPFFEATDYIRQRLLSEAPKSAGRKARRGVT